MEEGKQTKIPKLVMSVKKPDQMVLDQFEIFTQTYFGKLTNIVDFFENLSQEN